MIQGYSRKGTALEFKKQYELAVLAYEEGLKFCPDNELLKKGVESAKRHLTGLQFCILLVETFL